MALATDPSSQFTEPSLPLITPARIDRVESAAGSYRKLEAEILALPESQVGRVTTDVGQAAAIALGALPNLLKLRKEFEAFANADYFIKKLDTLQDYAMAAFYTHVRSLPDSTQQELLQLLERGKPLRERLLAFAEALVGFGLFDAQLVQSIRQGHGNLDTAKDLAALATLYSANWDRLQNKVPFTLSQIEEAGHIGAKLLHAIGIKAVGEAGSDERHDWPSLRARAFRLLVNEYEELQRAVAFVRWHHDDAAAFAPALHSGARKRKSSGKGPDKDAQPSADLPLSESPKMPSGAADIPAGLPGASPFEP